MVDIADWMKQEIFVRLSHDYFTKCQILQAMSYRWAQMNTTRRCFRMRHIDAKPWIHQCNAMFTFGCFVKGYLWWLPGLPGPWPCLCAIAPRHPGHRHNPCTRRDSEISSQTRAGRERVARSKSLMQKLCICVKLTKNNQASEEDKVSFSAPGQIFFSFPLIVNFLSAFYIFELRMTWLDETQI